MSSDAVVGAFKTSINVMSSDEVIDASDSYSPNTNWSKCKRWHIILFGGMVVIAMTSSIITAVILKQIFENDLKSIREEMASLHSTDSASQEGTWTLWSMWGVCSVTCNGGIRTRVRSCDRSDQGVCTGNDVDVSTCSTDICAESLYEWYLSGQFQIQGSSTYIRWGRTTCPGNGTGLVYEGYAGGSRFHHTGAAVNYICLPKDPDWMHYEDSHQDGGLVVGAQYRYDQRESSASFFDSQQSNLLDNDVPCAVCRSIRSTVLMVPAKNQCHAGWTHEYHGYLSAGNYNQTAASEYVCVDVDAELVDDGVPATNHDGKLFYFVEGRCGSLKCPPYVDGRELTCVVCTK